MKKILAIAALFALLCCGSVEELGIFGESRKQDVLGQDGVTPIPLSDSITLWTFGDTILGSWKGNVSYSATFSESVNITDMISNSLAFTEALKSHNINKLKFIYLKDNGRVCQFIKYKKDENPKIDRLWAVDGVSINNRVFVYYLIIKVNKKRGPFGFDIKGVGIAAWSMPNNWKIGDKVDFIRLPDLFPASYPAFGVTVLRRDGYIYTAGQYVTKDHSSPIKIARTEITGIASLASYKYLTKEGQWIKDINKAAPFLGDVMGECSLTYNAHIGKYMIIYCQLWTGKIVMVAFSDFSDLYRAEKRIIYEPPKLIDKGENRPLLYYSGKEIFSADNLIYMIYINPMEYQPYLLKINL